MGLIRREEEVRALALAGISSSHFLALPDFHFTLSAEEAARRWGNDFVCDVTRIVRLRRPEVIVTMWPGPGTHGQHQMAARAAIQAYARGGDPTFCASQIEREGVVPFAPAKLYVYPPEQSTAAVQIPADGFSRTTRFRYADLRAMALMQYRSQGYDLPQQVPAKDARPDQFLLAATRVPIVEPETDLDSGALSPAGTSPIGVRLEANAEYRVPTGAASPVVVALENRSGLPLEAVRLSIAPPRGFTATGLSPEFERVEPGARVEARFTLEPGPSAEIDRNAAASLSYTATRGGQPVSGSRPLWVRAIAPLRVAFVPLHDVAGYRDFARKNGVEWLIESLPTRLPLVVGRTTDVAFDLENSADAPAAGSLDFELPAGLRVKGIPSFKVPAKGKARITAQMVVDASALPAGRHAARLPVTVRVSGGAAHDVADAFLLPALNIPRVATAPRIDGDLSDLPESGAGAIGPADRWWRKAPEGDADLSGEFRVAYDEKNLYVGVRVRDDVVVCNIAPDDVKAQLRSDAVGITIDPTGKAEDTSAAFQFAAFPCTTAGFGARAFRDADARPGVVEQSAPGTLAVSRRGDDGYTLEVAIPWSALPSRPKPGDEIGLNVVLYDADAKDARVGANVSESGLAWAAFEWGGKQALPYLWGRAKLAGR
jgi:LmbE family N-acetylglucosaminyl deacetylase